mmetsp:Transcript_6906/g.16937  ORF Transcript_6906/g.16937 Transcript_6906/m.16937 type:complete len:151 (+) Transcript_6906:160-612(+)
MLMFPVRPSCKVVYVTHSGLFLLTGDLTEQTWEESRVLYLRFLRIVVVPLSSRTISLTVILRATRSAQPTKMACRMAKAIWALHLGVTFWRPSLPPAASTAFCSTENSSRFPSWPLPAPTLDAQMLASCFFSCTISLMTVTWSPFLWQKL